MLAASYAAAQLIGAPVLGRLSDRHGRRPVLLVSIAGTAVGFVLLGLAEPLGTWLAGLLPASIAGEDLVSATNRYIDTTAPFKLAKDESQRERLGTILYTCVEAVRIVLMYLSPLMPDTMAAGLAQINWQAPPGRTIVELASWGQLPPGGQTQKGQPLFPRKS